MVATQPPLSPEHTAAAPTDVESACKAFVVLLYTPDGKYRRRVFLSLHSATAAVQRAKAKGQPVRMVLCRLEPVAADLELAGWGDGS
jgi:hypothetical protein